MASEPSAKASSSAVAPATLKMAALRAQQGAPGYDFAADGEGVLRSHAGSPSATAEVAATLRGVSLAGASDGGFQLAVETTSVGRDGAPASRAVLDRHAEGQELVLDRADGVEERFLAGPLGLEQSFVVSERPDGDGALVVEVAFTGLAPDLAGNATDRVLLRDEAGMVRAGYRDLVVADAEGRDVAGHMEVRGSTVALVIDDAGASYPLRIDPTVWTQQAELTASDGASDDCFGFSVAVSGGTAVVGAAYRQVGNNAYQGAAYVFVQNGTTWTQQAELTASDGAAEDHFGFSVAVSGGTAIVSAHTHQVGSKASQGAAYVFVQSGTTWTQRAELTASDGAANDQFSISVAVSGGTAVVGAYKHAVGGKTQQGAAYVFVENGTTWTQQAELTASDGAASDLFGQSVAVSGGTAIIGAYAHEVGGNASQGAAYVFVQSGTTWTQQAELTANDGAASDSFGLSVALSGGTAIVGADGHNVGGNTQQGAAYVFTQSGTTWTQQAELTANDGAPGYLFGWSVAVSGGTALIGAQVGNAGYGAAYVFAQSGATWTQQAEFNSTGSEDDFGASVAMSGGTAVVGAYQHEVGLNPAQGAAYVYDFCVISGTAYPAGTVNPANSCQVCTPATSATAWSNEPNGTSCDTNGTCSSGSCACNTGFSGATCSQCAPNYYDYPTCTYCVASTTCGGEGTCTSTGGCTCNTGFGGTNCNACAPNYYGYPSCTYCVASTTCSGEGTCSSTGSCTCKTGYSGASCNACATGYYGYPSCVEGCLIGGTTYTSGEVNPSNACQVCTPSSSTTGWSNVADGTSCNDGNLCTSNDVCTAGACGGTPFTCVATSCQASSTCNGSSCTVVNAASGTSCPSDGNPCHADACDGSGNCTYPNQPDGTSCGSGEVCSSGSCNPACFIDGVTYAPGTVNPANACQVCAPATSTTAWSNEPDGTFCGSGQTCASGVCLVSSSSSSSGGNGGGSASSTSGTGGGSASSTSGTGGGSASSSTGAGGSGSSCTCSGTGIDGPVTVNCGQTACGTDDNTYACSASGWSLSADGCSTSSSSTASSSGSDCTCSGTGIDGPVTVSCGQSACGTDDNTYACSASGWSYSTAGCTSSCSCSGQGIDGPVTVNCGQTACGTDDNTYACSASGWSLSANGCSSGSSGSSSSGSSCTCSGTGIDGPVTVNCGQTACGTDDNTYACSASGWSYQVAGCN